MFDFCGMLNSAKSNRIGKNLLTEWARSVAAPCILLHHCYRVPGIQRVCGMSRVWFRSSRHSSCSPSTKQVLYIGVFLDLICTKLVF